MNSESQTDIGKNIGAQGLPVLNVGNPGNKGGSGRPKADIRWDCAQDFDTKKQVALDILADEKANASDKLKALDLLGKYGGLQQVDQTSGDEPLKTVVDLGDKTVEELKSLRQSLPKSP